MLDTKKILTKILKRTTGSHSYNTNNGTLLVEWTRVLFVIFATLTVHNSTNWGTGSGNRITCTVGNDIPLPVGIPVGVELNGIFAHISGTTFRAQNNTGTTLPANSNYNVSLTYITGGGYSITYLLSTLRGWRYVRREKSINEDFNLAPGFYNGIHNVGVGYHCGQWFGRYYNKRCKNGLDSYRDYLTYESRSGQRFSSIYGFLYHRKYRACFAIQHGELPANSNVNRFDIIQKGLIAPGRGWACA